MMFVLIWNVALCLNIERFMLRVWNWDLEMSSECQIAWKNIFFNCFLFCVTFPSLLTPSITITFIRNLSFNEIYICCLLLNSLSIIKSHSRHVHRTKEITKYDEWSGFHVSIFRLFMSWQLKDFYDWFGINNHYLSLMENVIWFMILNLPPFILKQLEVSKMFVFTSNSQNFYSTGILIRNVNHNFLKDFIRSINKRVSTKKIKL